MNDPHVSDWRDHLPNEPMIIMSDNVRDIATLFARREEIHTALSTSAPPVKPQRYQSAGRTAVISVTGALVDWGDADLARYGASSYGWIAEALSTAAADDAIDKIVMVIDSPGGVARGAEQAVDAIRSAKERKPVIAQVNGLAASGGYLLASQAHEIAMTRTSMIGNIGAVIKHTSIAGALDKAGVSVSLIYSGKSKVDGHPFSDLPDDVLASLQEEVDDIRIGFADDVGIGRGNRLTASQALATEAKVYRGQVRATGRSAAIDAGLADRISVLRDTIASSFQTSTNKENLTMTISQTDHDAAVSAATTAERARVSGIMTLPEAAGRQAAATAAVVAGLSIDQARSVLAAAPMAVRSMADSGRDPVYGLSFVDTGEEQKSADVSALWDKAAAKQNARFVDPNKG